MVRVPWITSLQPCLSCVQYNINAPLRATRHVLISRFALASAKTIDTVAGLPPIR